MYHKLKYNSIRADAVTFLEKKKEYLSETGFGKDVKQDAKMANSHMKRCSTLLGKCKLRPLCTYYEIPLRYKTPLYTDQNGYN